MKGYLVIDHVDKTFVKGSVVNEVLTDVSLSIEKGEFVSIIGHSGCGKSTLLNIVAGLTLGHKGCRAARGSRGQRTRPGSRRRVPEPLAAAMALGL